MGAVELEELPINREAVKRELVDESQPIQTKAFDYVPDDFMPRIAQSPFADGPAARTAKLSSSGPTGRFMNPKKFLMDPKQFLNKSTREPTTKSRTANVRVAEDGSRVPRWQDDLSSGATQAEPVTPKDQAQAKMDEANRRSRYMSDLRTPMSPTPLQYAVSYIDSDGENLKKTSDSEQWIVGFAGYGQLPVSAQNIRQDAYSGMWFEKYASWQSPNLRYRPLYFEDPNLERYGASRGRVQPLASAIHFFASTMRLPYQMGAEGPCCPQYAIGHGRPGNQYCLPSQKLVWSRRGASFQALLLAAGIWGLP